MICFSKYGNMYMIYAPLLPWKAISRLCIYVCWTQFLFCNRYTQSSTFTVSQLISRPQLGRPWSWICHNFLFAGFSHFPRPRFPFVHQQTRHSVPEVGPAGGRPPTPARPVPHAHVQFLVHVNTVELALHDPILQRMESNGYAYSTWAQQAMGNFQSIIQLV